MTYHDIPVTTEAGRLATYIQQEAEHALGNAPYDGGCRTFYTPEEWTARGESYGRQSLLVVVHDGGDYAHCFNYAYGSTKVRAGVHEALRAAGYYAESCTAWYTAIYPINEAGDFAQV